VGASPIGGTIGGGGICVTPEGGGRITVRIDTRGTGHFWPTGAAQDRRAWLEVVAYDAANSIVFSSGVVPDDKDPDELGDPNLVALGDRTFQADGKPAHFFWDVATEKSNLLRGPSTLDPSDPAFDHSTTATFAIGEVANQIDHVTARVRIRAVPRALLRDLVASGDLDAAATPSTTTLSRVTPVRWAVSNPSNVIVVATVLATERKLRMVMPLYVGMRLPVKGVRWTWPPERV